MKNSTGIAKSIFTVKVNATNARARNISQTNGLSGPNPEALALIISCLELLYGKGFSEKELGEMICDGGDDQGGDETIDAVVFSSQTIDVFDFKTDNKMSKKDLNAFFQSVEANVLDVPPDYKIFNKTLEKSLKKRHARRLSNTPIRIYVMRGTGAEKTDYFLSEKKRLESFDLVESVNLLTPEDLLLMKLESEAYTDEWTVDFNHDGEIYKFIPNEELLVKIPLQELVSLENTCRGKGLDLFNKNVRSFLKNKVVSEGILETLRSHPNRFYKFHNGLTMAAAEIVPKSPKRYAVKAPQIINGAQTINGIVQALNSGELTDTNGAYVLCKIYVADRELTEKICETSNTQAKVDLSDLRANDDIQFLLGMMIESLPSHSFTYLRKKPFSQRGKNVVNLPEFTQWIYSALFKKPADAKNKKRLLFDATVGGLYETIYANSLLRDISTLENLCEIGTFARARISKEGKRDKRLMRNADLHLIAGLFHIGGKPDETKYNRIKKILKAYVAKEQLLDKDVSLNKLFTKSDKAWEELEKKL